MHFKTLCTVVPLCLSFLLTLPGCRATKQAAPADGNEKGGKQNTGVADGLYHRGVLIIYYDKSVGAGPLLKAAERYGSEIIYRYNIISGVALRVPENKSDEEAIAYYKKVKGVLQVARDRIYHLQTTPLRPQQ